MPKVSLEWASWPYLKVGICGLTKYSARQAACNIMEMGEVAESAVSLQWAATLHCV